MNIHSFNVESLPAPLAHNRAAFVGQLYYHAGTCCRTDFLRVFRAQPTLFYFWLVNQTNQLRDTVNCKIVLASTNKQAKFAFLSSEYSSSLSRFYTVTLYLLLCLNREVIGRFQERINRFTLSRWYIFLEQVTEIVFANWNKACKFQTDSLGYLLCDDDLGDWSNGECRKSNMGRVSACRSIQTRHSVLIPLFFSTHCLLCWSLL